MYYRIIIKDKNGDKTEEKYYTTQHFKWRLLNLQKPENKKDIKCIWYEPLNKPWERKRIDF